MEASSWVSRQQTQRPEIQAAPGNERALWGIWQAMDIIDEPGYRDWVQVWRPILAQVGDTHALTQALLGAHAILALFLTEGAA